MGRYRTTYLTIYQERGCRVGGGRYCNGIPTVRPTPLMVLCSFAFLYGSCSVNANTKSVFVPLFRSPCAELLWQKWSLTIHNTEHVYSWQSYLRTDGYFYSLPRNSLKLLDSWHQEQVTFQKPSFFNVDITYNGVLLNCSISLNLFNLVLHSCGRNVRSSQNAMT
jgi:hypothetical protein